MPYDVDTVQITDLKGSCRIDGTSTAAMGHGTGSHVDNLARGLRACSKLNRCSKQNLPILLIGCNIM